MIKTIKIGALVSFLMILGGMAFKNQHLMGADVLLTAGTAAGIVVSILMIGLLPGQSTTNLEKFSLIFASLAISVIFAGFLFKVLHWPGAAKLIWIADLAIVVSSILFLVDGFREKDPMKSVLKIMSMFFLLFLLMLIVVSG